MNLKRVIKFGRIAYYSKRKIYPVEVTIELRDSDTDKPEFVVSCEVWNSKRTDTVMGGQCLDSVALYFKNDKLYQLILNLWKKYHLNGLNAGTAEQLKCICDHNNERESIKTELINKAFEVAKIEFGYDDSHYQNWCKRNNFSEYQIDCEILKRNGLYEVELDGKPYKYGTKWLYSKIPEEDLKKIYMILDKERSVESLYNEKELYT